MHSPEHQPVSSTALNSPATSRALQLIADDMVAVDQVIRGRLDSTVPLVADVCEYIITAGGKRLRPALLLLVSRSLGVDSAYSHLMAAVIEFIHTATLLHDDVVDESTLRRGRATANSRFGNPASVLVGDFLYSRAFQMMVEPGDFQIMKILADATNVIAEGEVQQLMNMHDPDLGEAAYLHVIRSKTAKLFEASARLGAVLASSEPAVGSACAHYGRSLGTAFQIIDDVLDYDGDAAVMGKNLGDDLREGKVTLPLICALQRANSSDKRLIADAIEHGHTQDLPRIVDIVRGTGSLEFARNAAAAEAQSAIDAARHLPTNEYSDALIQLAANLLDRKA